MKKLQKLGRPREHDRDKIAQDLVDWAKLPDSINLNKFCAIKEISPCKLTIWADKDESFRKAFELAKAYLGARREELLSKGVLHVKAYDLNAKTYDYFLKQEHRQQLEYESSLKKEEIAKFSKEELERSDALMEQLKAAQSSVQSLTKAESHNKSAQ